MCLNQFMATLEYFLPLLEFTQVQKIHLESDVNAADYDINACAGRLSVRGTALFFVTNKGKQKTLRLQRLYFAKEVSLITLDVAFVIFFHCFVKAIQHVRECRLHAAPARNKRFFTWRIDKRLTGLNDGA